MNTQFMRTLHIYSENTGKNSRMFSKSEKYAEVCGNCNIMRVVAKYAEKYAIA